MASQGSETSQEQEQDEQSEPEVKSPSMKFLLQSLIITLDNMTDLTTKLQEQAHEKGPASADAIEKLLRAFLLSQSHQACMLKEMSIKVDRLIAMPALPSQEASSESTPGSTRLGWTIRSPGRMPVLPEQQQDQAGKTKKLRRQGAQYFDGQTAGSRKRSRSRSRTVSYDLRSE
jgi:hypothetical protein